MKDAQDFCPNLKLRAFFFCTRGRMDNSSNQDLSCFSLDGSLSSPRTPGSLLTNQIHSHRCFLHANLNILFYFILLGTLYILPFPFSFVRLTLFSPNSPPFAYSSFMPCKPVDLWQRDWLLIRYGITTNYFNGNVMGVLVLFLIHVFTWGFGRLRCLKIWAQYKILYLRGYQAPFEFTVLYGSCSLLTS